MFWNSALATPGHCHGPAGCPRGEGSVEVIDCRAKGQLHGEGDCPIWAVHRCTLYPRILQGAYHSVYRESQCFKIHLVLNTLSSEQRYPFLSPQPAWHRPGGTQTLTTACVCARMRAVPVGGTYIFQVLGDS